MIKLTYKSDFDKVEETIAPAPYPDDGTLPYTPERPEHQRVMNLHLASLFVACSHDPVACECLLNRTQIPWPIVLGAGCIRQGFEIPKMRIVTHWETGLLTIRTKAKHRMSRQSAMIFLRMAHVVLDGFNIRVLDGRSERAWTKNVE